MPYKRKTKHNAEDAPQVTDGYATPEVITLGSVQPGPGQFTVLRPYLSIDLHAYGKGYGVASSKGPGVVTGVDDGAGDIAPGTGWVTCDTRKCEAYIAAVSDMSETFTNKWLDLVHAYLEKNPNFKDEPPIVVDFMAWFDGHRKPWILRVESLKKDCDSTLSGPCKDALAVAEAHENAILKADKTFKSYSGKSSGVTGIVQEGDSGPKSKGFTFPSFGAGAGFGVAAVAGLSILLLLRK